MKKILLTLLIASFATLGLAQVSDYEQITYPEAKSPTIVKPEKLQLKNGLTVLLLEDRELPVISGRILFHAGSVRDPKGKEGLASLVGDTMRTAGNLKMTGDEMDDYLESIAASVESFSSDTSAGVSFRCLKENADKVMDLFVATIRKPVFEAEKVDVARKQMKTAVLRRNDDPKSIAAREFNRRVYGLESPLSAMTELASLDAITQEDLTAYHSRYFVPSNAVLAVWGDFDAKQMKKQIKALFGDWTGGTVKPADLDIHSAAPGVYFVKRQDVTQSNIRVGHLGVTRDNPDFPAIALFSRLLGGGFDSRMMKIIRRDKGLSYSPHGSISANWKYPGSFWMSVNTKLESTGEVLDILKQIVHNMQTEGVSKEELDQARDGYVNAFVFQFDSMDEIIGRALMYEFYDYPRNFTETFFEGLKKVTPEDVQKVANKYVDLNKLIIMVVGDDTKFDKPLSEYGPVTEVDVTIPKPEAEKSGAEATEATLKKGSALLRKAIDKMDPNGKLKDATYWQTEAKADVSRGGMQMQVEMTATIRYPDSLVQEVRTQMGNMTTVITPEKAEMVIPGMGTRPLPAAQKEAIVKGIAKSVPAIASLARAKEARANLVKSGEFNGQPAMFVDVPVGDETITVVIGEDNSILGTVEQSMDQTGTMVEKTSVWSDWKDFDGILYPATIVQKAGEDTTQTVTTTAVRVNPEGAEALFQ